MRGAKWMWSTAALPLAVAALAWAGQEDQTPPAVIEAPPAAPAGPPGAAPPAKPYPDYAEVTKDMESRAGLFTLWFYPESAQDKDKERLLCQIPASLLGKKFMVSTSFSGGGFFTGFPLDERVVKWELLHDKLLLIEPETHFVVDQAKEVSDVVHRTYPERIRAAVPLATKSPAGDPVIDLGALLKGDFADIAWISMFESGHPTAINSALSKWTKKKSFPQNVEIGVELALAQTSPPGSFSKKLVHFSFWNLQDSDYQPRVADDRVGYFLTARQDWSKPSAERDIFDRYVNRWQLQKRDPNLKLCDPKQPITFYIEKTVPVRFRRAVRDGILEWNKAFEKVGFINAVEVRQQTDDNEWAALDPEDMRYSFFRWIVTGMGFAMGPSRANPFTGQIYDADIIFDDSMVRFFEQSVDHMVTEEALAMRLSDPALKGFLAEHPEWLRPVQKWERTDLGTPDTAAMREAMAARLNRRGQHHCDYAMGMRHQLALAGSVLAGAPPERKEQFLYDIIKEVVMHEVGHTLGLRHNFKASSVYSLEDIKQRMLSGQATTGSVMDYNPALFTADAQLKEGHFITPTVGSYDYWAIEYGYRPTDGTYESKTAASPATPVDKADKIEKADKATPAAGASEAGKAAPADAAAAAAAAAGAAPKKPGCEMEMLLDIAARAAEPELAYASDEDATFLGPDPRVNRFDAARDPVAWARDRVKLIDQRLSTILEWGVKDKESWYHLRPAFMDLFIEKAIVLDYVGRYIGGQYVTRSHRGDPGAAAPFELVDQQTQRQALEFIEETLFSDEYFSANPDVLNHLAAARWWHQGANVDFVVDFQIHELVSLLQWWNLFDRLFPNTLRRIHDAELKTHPSADGRLTVAEYLQRIQKGCWSGVCGLKAGQEVAGSDDKPYISDIRRSLQREYLGLVEPLVRNRPGTVLSPDLHSMVTHNARELKSDIDALLERSKGKLDFATEAHLHACSTRIDRMLSPELKELGS